MMRDLAHLPYPAREDPDYAEIGAGGHFVRREIIERYEGVFVKREPPKPSWYQRQQYIRDEQARRENEAWNAGRRA